MSEPESLEERILVTRNHELATQNRQLDIQELQSRTVDKMRTSSERIRLYETIIPHGPRYAWPAALIFCVNKLGGEETIIKVAAEFISQVSIPVYGILGWSAAVLLACTWYFDRKSKRERLEKSNAHIDKLESEIIAQRTTPKT